MSIGGRVKQLREMHGLTQLALVDRVPGLKQSRLSRLEADLADLDDELLELLAIALEVRSEFFLRESTNDIVGQSPQLRARSRLTKTARSSTLRWAQTIFEEYSRMEAGQGIDPRLIDASGSLPKEAALEVRRLLGFDLESPLPYLVLAIERLGVVVLGIPAPQDAMDAFCAWDNGRPLIGILEGAPGDRVRWSAAHELGHLVLHRGVEKHSRMESEADEFAAELLTPLNALRHSMPSSPQMSHLTVLKTQWGVSSKSLVRRARELGVIDEARALSFYKQMSARGWNKREPGYVPEEKPRAFRKLAELQYSDSPNVELMAADAAWSESLTSRVLSRHAREDELPYETESALQTGGNVVDLAKARRLRPGGDRGTHQLGRST